MATAALPAVSDADLEKMIALYEIHAPRFDPLGPHRDVAMRVLAVLKEVREWRRLGAREA